VGLDILINNSNFQGNNVLSNILCDLGYQNCSDFAVNPVTSTGPAVGSGCTDASQRSGTIDENGDCEFTVGGDCMKGSVPGKTDASGECITDDSGGNGTGGYSEEEKNIAGSIKDWVEGQIGKVKDMTAEDVLEAVFGSGGYTCELTGEGEEPWDCAGTDGTDGNQCWKDCVSASVLAGIPGLPMPPGAVDIGTVRDLENTANDIGTTVGNILNPDPADEDFIQKIKDWVTGKIDDLFGNVDDVTLEQITGWITGTLGNVLGSLILIETGDATNTVTTKIKDIVFGVAPDPDDPINCSDYGREGGEVTSVEDCEGCSNKSQKIGTDGRCRDEPVVDDFTVDCAAEGMQGDRGTKNGNKVTGCGPCLSTHQEIDGQCVEWKDTGDTEDDCSALNREYIPSPAAGTNSRCGGCLDSENYQLDEDGNCVPSPIICEGDQVLDSTGTGCVDPVDCIKGNACKTEDNKDGKYADNCKCIPDFVNDGPTPEECEAKGRYHVAAVPEQSKPSECGDCTNGSTNEDCSPTVETCSDTTATNYGEEGECKYGPIVETCSDTTATNYGEEGPCTYGPTVETCSDTTATNYGEEGPCTYGPTVEQ